MRRNVGYFVVIIHSVVLASLHKDPGVVYVGKYGNYTWPRHDLQAEIPGDIILGALHMVHERSDNKICGPIMPQGGIQALECMMYTLDRINEGDFLPGFSIGVLSKDDCDRDIYGLEQAVDFIRGQCQLHCICSFFIKFSFSFSLKKNWCVHIVLFIKTFYFFSFFRLHMFSVCGSNKKMLTFEHTF